MVKVFISHTWDEGLKYDQMTIILDQVLGHGQWTNVSVPQTGPIDVPGEQLRRQRSQVDRLEDELWEARARLSDPSLPDVVSRTVWRGGEQKELETVGTINAKIAAIRTRLEPFREMRQGLQSDSYTIDHKWASASVRASPELSIAIRNRMEQADIMLLLITSMVRLREWVDYEIALAALLAIPTIGIRAMSDNLSPDFRVVCDEVVEWDNAQIAAALKRLCKRVPVQKS